MIFFTSSGCRRAVYRTWGFQNRLQHFAHILGLIKFCLISSSFQPILALPNPTRLFLSPKWNLPSYSNQPGQAKEAGIISPGPISFDKFLLKPVFFSLLGQMARIHSHILGLTTVACLAITNVNYDWSLVKYQNRDDGIFYVQQSWTENG